MALFGSKKNKKDEGAAPEKKAVKAAKPEKADKKPAKAPAKPEKAAQILGKAPAKDVTGVLKQPRITEKASFVSEIGNVYVFDIDTKATKRDVVEAVRYFYKADPIRVNITMRPSKKVFVRGKRGVKSGGKKAYVYFEKGASIEII